MSDLSISIDNHRELKPVQGPAGLVRADLMDLWEVAAVIQGGQRGTESGDCQLCRCRIRRGQPLRRHGQYLCHEICFQHWREAVRMSPPAIRPRKPDPTTTPLENGRAGRRLKRSQTLAFRRFKH